jgi:hypothetical protein
VLRSVSDRTIIDRNYVHGGAAPSFVVDAVGAAVVLAGSPPRENVGKAVAEKRRQLKSKVGYFRAY